MIPNSLIIVNMDIPQKEKEIIFCHANRIEELEDSLLVRQMEALYDLVNK